MNDNRVQTNHNKLQGKGKLRIYQAHQEFNLIYFFKFYFLFIFYLYIYFFKIFLIYFLFIYLFI